jgi:hypothetical protein
MAASPFGIPPCPGRQVGEGVSPSLGTSVDQIERFYARNLPLSKEMARNLQSFGGAD